MVPTTWPSVTAPSTRTPPVPVTSRIGHNAGYNLTTGSNNIDISNEGSAGDNGTIKIGAASTQTKTFIAGIENSKVVGAAVYVTSSGQLGVLASSERYKTAIAPMGPTTAKLGHCGP